MDRKLSEESEIQRLIQLSAASRRFLETEATSLKNRLDVPSRVRESLKRNPSTWMAGSMVSGLAASLLFRRRPAAVKKTRGLPAILLGLTLTAARPMAKVWLANQLKQWINGLAANSPSPSSANRPYPDSHISEIPNSR
jgi:hypothetical protein